MHMDKEDYIKKALLDTQERVRDFMHYSEKIEDGELKSFFKDYALTEGRHAEQLQEFLSKLENI